MNKRERVKIMLIHYFRISNRENRWDSDNDSEINELVDLLIDAAKEELQAKEESNLHAEYKQRYNL